MSETGTTRELLLHELGDLLTAERTIEAMLPTLKEEAGDRELSRGFDRHLKETRRHVKALERAFKELGAPVQQQPCPGIEGIKREHDEFVSEGAPQEVLDVFLTGAAARTEHYEIASYEGVISLARALGERGVVDRLTPSLKDEKEMLKETQKTGRRLARDAAKSERSRDEESSGTTSRSRRRTTRSSSSVATTDHETIRRWVEERGGRPSRVRGTGRSRDAGLLRIDFPGRGDDDSLEEIGWDEFFEKFDDEKLAFVYQERTRNGRRSRFSKLVSR